MKNRFFAIILNSFFLSQAFSIERLEDITVESLMKDVSEEHVICMQEILREINPRNMLEFGLGLATKYFLESCKRVVSVEVVTNGYGPETIRKYLQMYRDYSNWVPIAYFSGYRGDMSWAPYKYVGSDAVYVAGSYQCATHLSYEPIDPFYLKELGEFIGNVVKYNKIELALIHANIFLRGDMIQLCFHKIPIIVANFTSCRANGEKNDVWGYSQVKTPPEYVEIYIPTSRGTTVWVSRKPEFQPLINALSSLQLQ
jgi:hypothetical protein